MGLIACGVSALGDDRQMSETCLHQPLETPTQHIIQVCGLVRKVISWEGDSAFLDRRVDRYRIYHSRDRFHPSRSA